MLTIGRVVGRYSVEGVLGSGAMGEVYRVRDREDGQVRALKFMPLAGHAVRERMLREARAMAELAHPNVVGLIEVLDIEGDPGLVMEVVEGPSLKEFLEHRRPDTEEAETLFRGVLAGVAHAHSTGLVHRDLKPSNILLATTPEGLVPKVADFGIAKDRKPVTQSLGGQLTRTGSALGSPAYMAPEQIRDARDVDARADVFSLGCILYELLAGERAFQGDDPLLVMNAVVACRYRPLGDVVPGIEERFVRVVDGCLRVERGDRLAGVEEIVALLGPPPGQGPNLMLIGVAAGVAAAVVAGGGLAVYFALGL